MKLKFKKEEGDILIEVEGESFSTDHYIKMIEDIKMKEKIEYEFDSNIEEDEKISVISMIDKINKIGEKEEVSEEDNIDTKQEELVEEIEEINPEDIPF